MQTKAQADALAVLQAAWYVYGEFSLKLENAKLPAWVDSLGPAIKASQFMGIKQPHLLLLTESAFHRWSVKYLPSLASLSAISFLAAFFPSLPLEDRRVSLSHRLSLVGSAWRRLCIAPCWKYKA